jgi:phenol 2-monooxygenase (NADPH)
VNEAYWVNEVCFWRPDPQDQSRIKRAGRIRDTEEDLSEFPHVIVNQARMLAYLRDHMARPASRLEPLYGLLASELEIDTHDSSGYPVTVTVRHLDGPRETGETSIIRAKYVVGCDGARSAIRPAIGRELVGDATNESWGVMDALTITDFPDIRVKCVISSANDGNILIIPREGGFLVRIYIELDEVSDREILESRRVTPEKLAEVANRIMHPYTVQIKDVGWSSVYQIGQRLCDKFDDVPVSDMPRRVPRVFIAGDACHTHSAKAGQGMNVSMADAWNLGWKLASVLKGTAGPELLHTYSEERQAVAKQLIDFDRDFSRRFRARSRASSDVDMDEVDPAEFQRHFIREGRFTAGVATRYAPSMITGDAEFRHLAAGFPIGMRFHSARVLRLADAKPVHLGHVARADGAWRIYLFADREHPARANSHARGLCECLGSDASVIRRFTPAGDDPDSLIDVRAVFQQGHRDLDLDEMPAVLLPRKGKFGLIDYEKMFCPDPAAGDIFELRGVNRETGCMVIVRPDQYVAHILPLEGHEALTSFLGGVLIERS